MDDKLSCERQKIDAIDKEIAALFVERMKISKAVSRIKKQNSLDTYVPDREKMVLENVSRLCGDRLAPYAVRLWETILALSREYQDADDE